MARLNSGTISKRTVEALPVGEQEAVFWDRELSGFGVRVYPSGSKVYLVQTRAGGRSRRVTIGRHGIVSAEQARRKAAMLIAGMKAGEEPGRNGGASAGGPTLTEVGERYLREHVAVRCKPTTAGAYRHALNRFLLPAFGSLPLVAIGRDQVASLHYRLHKTPTMANQVVDTLTRLFVMAEAWGVAPEGGNPCRFVKKYRKRSCERFLSEQEFRRLGRVLSELEARAQVVGKRDCGIPAADADRVQAQRDPDSTLGGRGPGVRRAQVEGRQDGGTAGGAVAGGAEGAGRPAPASGQPMGDYGVSSGTALGQPERPVGCSAQAGRSQRRADSRPSSFLCFQSTGPGRKSDNDRETARAPAGADHGPLCPPCTGVGEDVGREGCAEHCNRYEFATTRHCGNWRHSACEVKGSSKADSFMTENQSCIRLLASILDKLGNLPSGPSWVRDVLGREVSLPDFPAGGRRPGDLHHT